MFGKLFAIPIRILNVPFRAIEKIVADTPKEDAILSRPLEKLAEAIEEIDGDKTQ